MEYVRNSLGNEKQLPTHLDSLNDRVVLADHALNLLDTKGKPVVSANAYLRARAIVKGLELGIDILICGCVADASQILTNATGYATIKKWELYIAQTRSFLKLRGVAD